MTRTMNRIITYDLRVGRDYDRLHKAIEALGPHEDPLESVWLVESPLPVTAICQHLQQHVDEDDGLFVGELGASDGFRLKPSRQLLALQEALKHQR